METYFQMGTTRVVANLWDVTDKDIDRFTVGVLERVDDDNDDELGSFVCVSRTLTKLRYLVGAAPVIYVVD